MMRFTCPRAVLAQALKIAGRAIKSRSPFPITEMIRFTAAGDETQGVVSLYGTDTEFAIQTSFPAPVRQAGCVCIPAKRITEIVTALPEQPLQFKCTDELGITVSSGKSLFRLNGTAHTEMPLFPAVEDPSGLVIPEALLHRMLKRVGYAAAKDDTRPRLTGSCLTITGNVMELAATDAHTLAVARQEFEGDLGYMLRVIIPREAQAELLNLTKEKSEETVSLWADSQQILVSTAGWSLKSRMIDGDFPDYTGFFPTSIATEVELDRALLIAGLKRVHVVAKDELHRARCQFAAGTLRMRAVTDEQEMEEELEAEQSGPDQQVAIHTGQMLTILEVFAGERVRLSLNGPLRPIWLQPVGQPEEYSAINMPMNPE